MLSNAYVAGLVDGEGWIGLATNSGETYRARVTIGMTLPAKAILAQLQEQWGGSLKMSRAATERWAEAWAWTLSGAEAEPFLIALQPHLRIKKRQTVLVLEVERLRSELPKRPNGSAGWNMGTRTRCEQIKAELHRINSKGPKPADSVEESRVNGKSLATWNPARGVWEKEQMNLCGHSELYSETWPTSGSMRGGTVFELPRPAPRTVASASSSSPILPTPTSRDWKDGQRQVNVPINSLLGRAVWDLDQDLELE